MKRMLMLVLSLVVLSMLATNASAGRNVVDTVLEGCKTELKSFCSNVTPGEGRLLACLYAHGDKLSGQCEYALYDAAVQLERAVAALTYIANECEEDVVKNCASVQAGEGRILNCLKKQGDKVSGRCRQALKDVGVK